MARVPALRRLRGAGRHRRPDRLPADPAAPKPRRARRQRRGRAVGSARLTAIPAHRAAALGLVQGPAELLPVSSSAHLNLIPWLAGWDWDRLDPEVRKSFEVVLHAGAAAALLIGQRRVIGRELREFDLRRAAV